MKKISYFVLLFSLLTSCLKNENPIDMGAKAGGNIVEFRKLIPYYYGTALIPKLGKIKIYQADEKIVKINIYKQFFSNDTELTGDLNAIEVVSSNKNLLKSINVTNSYTSVQDFSFLYSDLIQGLVINENALPLTDNSLSVGSYWELTFESVMDDGRIVSNINAKIIVGISTRFAGTYKILNAEYYRIGVLRTDVEYPREYNIQSVNNTTYKILDYAGPFDDNQTLFSIEQDGSITYPAGQSFNGFGIITCQLDADKLTNVRCGSSNYSVLDTETDKDKLFLSYGYYTNTGPAIGPREFYIELEKIP